MQNQNSSNFFFFFLAIVIKPSNIRIWIHDKDIGKLSRVLWEGQGNRLRTEVSSNGKVKKFLEAVPFVMVSCFIFISIVNNYYQIVYTTLQNIIKDIHSAVVDNDLDLLIGKTSSLPAVLLSSKDANGLTPLHKVVHLISTIFISC